MIFASLDTSASRFIYEPHLVSNTCRTAVSILQPHILRHRTQSMIPDMEELANQCLNIRNGALLIIAIFVVSAIVNRRKKSKCLRLLLFGFAVYTMSVAARVFLIY